MSDVQRSLTVNSRLGSVWTVVVAGGSGRRFGSMKQFESLGDKRVLDHCVDMALVCSTGVVLVVPSSDLQDEVEKHAVGGARSEHRVAVCAGGPTRTASVRRGLALVPGDAGIILVHDAARPFASENLFRSVIKTIEAGADGSIPGLPVVDTVKVIEVTHSPFVGLAVPHVVTTPDRATLVAVQTPQAFSADILRRAYLNEIDGTDDSSLVEAIGGTVIVVPGEANNRKITHRQDLLWAREFLVTGQA